MAGLWEGLTAKYSKYANRRNRRERREGSGWGGATVGEVVRAQDGVVPEFGTGEFSLPRAGIVRPFSFSLREVRVRFGGRELRAVHTKGSLRIQGLRVNRRVSIGCKWKRWAPNP